MATLTKEAPVTVLLHATATVTASQQLPGADAAHAAGARGFYLQNIGHGEDAWLTLDGSEAAVDSAFLLECLPIEEFLLPDVRTARIFAESPCLVSVSYVR